MHSGMPRTAVPIQSWPAENATKGGDGLDDFALLWNNLLWFSQVTGSTYGRLGKVAPGRGPATSTRRLHLSLQCIGRSLTAAIVPTGLGRSPTGRYASAATHPRIAWIAARPGFS